MLMGLRTGSTTSVGFQAETNGQDSSEVAAEAEVKVGVVMLYRKCYQTPEIIAKSLGDKTNKHARQSIAPVTCRDENVGDGGAEAQAQMP
jgi:hypothetical protein